MINFLIKVLNKFKLLSFFNFYVHIKINNKKVTIPIINEIGYGNINFYEEWMTKVLINIKPLFKGTFVDVGVNLGQTLIKAYSIFDNMHYIGFEPNPICVNYINDLVKVNKYKNCKLLPIGLSNAQGLSKLNFSSADRADSCASIIEGLRPKQLIDHYEFVPVFDYTSIKEILRDTEQPILKIDVEGAELEVIQGLLPWIKKCNPIILIEVLPVYERENNIRLHRQHQMENIFNSVDYKIARINKSIIEITELAEFGVHANIHDSDYILYPLNLKEPIHKCFQSYIRTA